MPMEQEKSRRIQNQPEPWSDRGEPVTASLFIFPYYAADDATFAA